MSSYQYRHSHVKDKTVSPTVLSLTWESPYLGKTVFILRQGPGSPFSDSPATSHSVLVIEKWSFVDEITYILQREPYHLCTTKCNHFLAWGFISPSCHHAKKSLFIIAISSVKRSKAKHVESIRYCKVLAEMLPRRSTKNTNSECVSWTNVSYIHGDLQANLPAVSQRGLMVEITPAS